MGSAIGHEKKKWNPLFFDKIRYLELNHQQNTILLSTSFSYLYLLVATFNNLYLHVTICSFLKQFQAILIFNDYFLTRNYKYEKVNSRECDF